MNWKEHAECRYFRRFAESDCNADRAEMIREGERLEREVQKWEVRCSAHRALGLVDMADLQAENARLREALRAIAKLGEIDEESSSYLLECAVSDARAALGEVKP